MTEINYPEALDSDDAETIKRCLETSFETKEVTIHDDGSYGRLHFGYEQKSGNFVFPGFLEPVQAAGFTILYAGTRDDGTPWAEISRDTDN